MLPGMLFVCASAVAAGIHGYKIEIVEGNADLHDLANVTSYPRYAEKGEQITLICVISNENEDQQSWVFENITISVEGQLIGNNSDKYTPETCFDTREYNITIMNLNNTDEGKWKCKRNNDQLFGVIEVIISEQADVPEWYPGRGVYIAPQTYNLTCKTSNVHPTPYFTWWYSPNDDDQNGTKIKGENGTWANSTGLYSYILYIPDSSNTVWYIWCEVNQEFFNEQSSRREKINVVYAPGEAEAAESAITSIVGVPQNGSVRLHCNLVEKGHPEASFNWSRQSGLSMQSDSDTETVCIDIKSVNDDDVYTCHPCNWVGCGTPASTRVTVLLKPLLEELTDTINVLYNADLSIPCSCTARPAPTIKWSNFNEKICEQTDPVFFATGERNLTTEANVYLQWKTNDTDIRKSASFNATCLCENEVGDNSSAVFVNVLYPALEARIVHAVEPPIIVTVEQVVALSCIVDEGQKGNPDEYSYNWTRLFNHDGAAWYPDEQNLSLTVSTNNLCDDDAYTCFATNTAGTTASGRVNVTFLVPPICKNCSEEYVAVRYDSSNFELNCEYSARPGANIMWSDFDETIYKMSKQSNRKGGECNMLTLTSRSLNWASNNTELRRKGSCVVRCAADNGVADVGYRNVSIDVQYPPLKAVGIPKRVTETATILTRNITLSCTVQDIDQGNPSVYIYNWTREYGTVPNFDPSSGNLTIPLDRNSIYLDDNYTCSVKNKIGVGDSGYVLLLVQVDPEYEEDAPDPFVVVNTEDNLSLPCGFLARPNASITLSNYEIDVLKVTEQVDASIPEIADGRNLITRSSRNLTWATSDLQLRKHGSGKFMCSGTNDASTVTRDLTLDVQYAAGSPEIYFNNSRVYAGETIWMTCAFTEGPNGTNGNPKVLNFTWMQDNDTIFESNESRVMVEVSSVNQEGHYSCFGTNYPAGKLTRSNVSDRAFFTVNVRPYILQPVSPQDVVILYDDDFTNLTCVAAGKPEVDFEWYFNDTPIIDKQFKQEKFEEDGDYLHDLKNGWRSYLTRNIANIDFTCNNINMYDGDYACMAYHNGSQSTKSSTTNLITHYPAFWAGPSMYPTHYASPGNNVTLTCEVCMKPPGNFTWFLNGKSVTENITYTANGPNLTVNDVQLNHFGNYSCKVTNVIFGVEHSREFDMQLVERGAPYPPKGFKANMSTSQSIDVLWTPGSRAGYDIQFFTLCRQTLSKKNEECDPPIEESQDKDNQVATIRGLLPSTFYNVSLHAENDHKPVNNSARVYVAKSTQDAPVINITRMIFNATTVTAEWFVQAGKPSSLALAHFCNYSCPRSLIRNAPEGFDDWNVLLYDISPDRNIVQYTIEPDDNIDTTMKNEFALWSYEPGLQAPSGEGDGCPGNPISPEGAGDDSNRVGGSVGLIVGVVLASLIVVSLAAGGFVYYRRKSDLFKEGQQNNEDQPDSEGLENRGFGDSYHSNDSIELVSSPSSTLYSAVNVQKKANKANEAEDNTAQYAIVKKSCKEMIKMESANEAVTDSGAEAYENVTFRGGEDEMLVRNEEGLIYMRLSKEGPVIKHPSVYPTTIYGTVDWVRTEEYNRQYPYQAGSPDNSSSESDTADDDDIFGELPFQKIKEGKNDDDDDDDNDLEDDGVDASRPPRSARAPGAFRGAPSRQESADSGHSSPKPN